MDYFGPFAAFFCMFGIVAIVCSTCILWWCIEDVDEINIFKKVSGGFIKENKILFTLIINFLKTPKQIKEIVEIVEEIKTSFN